MPGRMLTFIPFQNFALLYSRIGAAAEAAAGAARAASKTLPGAGAEKNDAAPQQCPKQF
jgi:hypothetical protein